MSVKKSNLLPILLTAMFVLVFAACQGADVPGPTDPSPSDVAVTAIPTREPTLPVEPSPLPQTEESVEPISCEPTPTDQLGPFYVPDAPVRSNIGLGHTLRGAVLSFINCVPLSNAQIEFWQVGPDGEYDDDHRATTFADESGTYTFESNFPPPYSGRPPHVHMRVSAEGHETLVTQYYPSDGQAEGTFELVLIPLE